MELFFNLFNLFKVESWNSVTYHLFNLPGIGNLHIGNIGNLHIGNLHIGKSELLLELLYIIAPYFFIILFAFLLLLVPIFTNYICMIIHTTLSGFNTNQIIIAFPFLAFVCFNLIFLICNNAEPFLTLFIQYYQDSPIGLDGTLFMDGGTGESSGINPYKLPKLIDPPVPADTHLSDWRWVPVAKDENFYGSDGITTKVNTSTAVFVSDHASPERDISQYIYRGNSNYREINGVWHKGHIINRPTRAEEDLTLGVHYRRFTDFASNHNVVTRGISLSPNASGDVLVKADP